MPEIGGLRHPKRDSINLAWKNPSFPASFFIRDLSDEKLSREYLRVNS